MSKLNGGLEALGTAMFVISFGGAVRWRHLHPRSRSTQPQRKTSSPSCAFPSIRLLCVYWLTVVWDESRVPEIFRFRTTALIQCVLKQTLRNGSLRRRLFTHRRDLLRSVEKLSGSHNGGVTKYRKVKLLYGLHWADVIPVTNLKFNGRGGDRPQFGTAMSASRHAVVVQ